MASPRKEPRSPLFHLATVSVVVVACLVAVFVFDSEELPPDEPTVIAEDDINAEPAGAGTLPEGEADEIEEGITELVDDVEPAPADIDTVPAADYVDSTGPDIEGETIADELVADTVDEAAIDVEVPAEEDELGEGPGRFGLTTIEASQAGGANAEQDDETGDGFLDEPDGQSATEEFLLDEETVGSENAEDVDMPGPEASIEGALLPAGRDAVTDLDPSECQDIVRDTDSGGAAFIPTPVGPGTNTRGECP